MRKDFFFKKKNHSFHISIVVYFGFFQLSFNFGPKLIEQLLFGLLLINIAEEKSSQTITR